MKVLPHILIILLLFAGTVPVDGLSPSSMKAAITTQITIPASAVATMLPTTTKVLPRFSIITDPPGAEIWFNGNKMPVVTPFDMPCGDIIFLNLKYPGYQDYSKMTGCYDQSFTLSVTLVPLTTTPSQTENPPIYNTPAYQPSVIQQTPAQPSVTGSQPSQSPAPGTGSLSVTTNPPGANILVDSIPVGASPATIPGLLAGMHNLTITKAGYVELITQVNIVGGQTMEYSTTLIPATNPTKPKSPGFEWVIALFATGIVLMKRK